MYNEQIICPFVQKEASVAFKYDGHYLWDASVIKADGKYWLFCSTWEEELGFGWNWLFHSRVILACSDKPEGPYSYVKTILNRRNPSLFDGMNTHNPNIKFYKGKYYLYHMGCTYDYDPPKHMDDITKEMIISTWNKKRIGLAISDKIDGTYTRKDEPILSPREGHWDSSITTNPTVVIKDNGETYMLYKSKDIKIEFQDDNPLRVGACYGKSPEGPFERLSDSYILDDNDNVILEDPYVWFDKKRNKFCALMKDCVGNVAGDYGALIYAESDDFVHFDTPKEPGVIYRTVKWKNGNITKQGNLERPCVLLDDNGDPEYLFCATGDGEQPWNFNGLTYIVCIRLEKRQKDAF